jgi:hypothetical protein
MLVLDESSLWTNLQVRDSAPVVLICAAAIDRSRGAAAANRRRELLRARDSKFHTYLPDLTRSFSSLFPFPVSFSGLTGDFRGGLSGRGLSPAFGGTRGFLGRAS